MKKISYFALATAVCTLFTMCQKNAVENINSNTELQTIRVNLVDVTKVAIAQGDSKLTLKWEEGDQLRVIGQTSEVYNIEAGFTDKIASFTGPSAGAGNKTVFYPGTYSDVSAIGARSYTDQLQDGTAPTAHLKFNAIATDLTSISELNLTASNTNAKINQAIKFVVKLPAGVTTVDSLILQAPSALFYTTNAGADKTDRLVLRFKNTDVSTSSQVLTAYMMMSWQQMDILSGTEFTVKVVATGQSEACCFSLKATTTQAYSWVGGKTFTFNMSSKELIHTVKGAGTEADPYLLYDVFDLLQMEKLVAPDVKTYFKLMADVDMTDVTTWNPINQGNTAGVDDKFQIGIDFNGNNHTISNFTITTNLYAGFIGVLNGKVHDVTFDKANITSNGKSAGVVCGYAGTGSYTGDMENVTVKNSTVTQNASAITGLVFGTNGVSGTYTNISAEGTVNMTVAKASDSKKVATGGIGGSSVCSKYTKCSFKGTINGRRLCGGIVGYERTAGSTFSQCSVDAKIDVKKITSATSENVGGIVGYWQGGTIENCWSAGSITATDQTAGGIVGNVLSLSYVKNCFSTMTVGNNKNYGGIVGKGSCDKWIVTYEKALEIEKCIYWGTKIDCGKAAASNGSSGSIVGFATVKNVMKDCWRINDSKFTFVNTGNTNNYPVDQPNNVPGTDEEWEVGKTPQAGTSATCCPYWGKAAAADKTASSVAKTLGWDETIWDLSGSEPKLK